MSDHFSDALRVVDQIQKNTKRDHDKVYASDASVELQIDDDLGPEIHGTCLRKQWYRINEVEVSDPEDATQRFVTGIGEAVHQCVGRIFKEAGMLLAEELSFFDKELKISGRVDLMICPLEDAKAGKKRSKSKVGIEVKSVGGYHGVKGVIKVSRDVPFYPKLHHLVQALVYLDQFHKRCKDIEEWQLLYIDRESGDFASHRIRYVNSDHILVNGEPTMITPDKIYSRWRRLWEHVETGSIPKRDFQIQYDMDRLRLLLEKGRLNRNDSSEVKKGNMISKGDAACGWCPYRTRCWTED